MDKFTEIILSIKTGNIIMLPFQNEMPANVKPIYNLAYSLNKKSFFKLDTADQMENHYKENSRITLLYFNISFFPGPGHSIILIGAKVIRRHLWNQIPSFLYLYQLSLSKKNRYKNLVRTRTKKGKKIFKSLSTYHLTIYHHLHYQIIPRIYRARQAPMKTVIRNFFSIFIVLNSVRKPVGAWVPIGP